jgi:glucosamine kinase
MFYLGIDGGGSGCRARLCDAGGQVRGAAVAGAANIASDPAGALTQLMQVAREAMAGHCAPTEVCVVLGVAGANIPSAAAALTGALAAAMPFVRLAVVSDAATALAGAVGPRDGVLAAIGTGSVFASQRESRVRQIGGWGYQLGDEGSGAWMGRQAMMLALRALDGFTPMTPLLQAVVQRQGSGAAVVEFARHASPAEVAALVPQICAAHAAGDPAAAGILGAACAEITAAIDLLQTEGAALPVVFTGGLGPLFAAELQGRWQILPEQGTGLDGAVARARDLAALCV